MKDTKHNRSGWHNKRQNQYEYEQRVIVLNPLALAALYVATDAMCTSQSTQNVLLAPPKSWCRPRHLAQHQLMSSNGSLSHVGCDAATAPLILLREPSTELSGLFCNGKGREAD